MATAPSTRPSLGVWDVAMLLVGVVVGAGIFRLPSLVAGSTSGPSQMMMVWALGGLISLVGALCYAELATSNPDQGGDYHFLHRAFGSDTAYLYAWARISVIQTGSIALQAFPIGDYLTEVMGLGPFSSAIYAAVVVVLITGLNIAGIRQGKVAQHFLTYLTILGLMAVTAAGFGFFGGGSPAEAAPAANEGGSGGAIGLAFVFALLAFGGWSETSYLSAEVRNRDRTIVWALILGLAIVTGLYLLANWAYLRTLGFAGLANSQAVAADVMRQMLGERGAQAISLIVAIAALSTTNATVITGARTAYAFGRDHPRLGFLGKWQEASGTPVNALVAQGVIALLLIVLGTVAPRDGFTTMVEYTAPVFWTFLLLVGISLFVLRRKEPEARRPFRVPLYPLAPALFCLVSAYMLYSSLAYTKLGALVGVAVLPAGVPLLLLGRTSSLVEQPALQGEP